MDMHGYLDGRGYLAMFGACFVIAAVAVLTVRWFYDELYGRPRSRYRR
jgi:hypothetical protein